MKRFECNVQAVVSSFSLALMLWSRGRAGPLAQVVCEPGPGCKSRSRLSLPMLWRNHAQCGAVTWARQPVPGTHTFASTA